MVENPPAPACQGHQSCEFKVQFPFQQLSAMLSAIRHLLLSCLQARNSRSFLTEGMALLQLSRNMPTSKKSQKKSMPKARRARSFCNVDRLAIWGITTICGTPLHSAPEFAMPSRTTGEHQKTTEWKTTGWRIFGSNSDVSRFEKTSLQCDVLCHVMCCVISASNHLDYQVQ